jgi:hypothetical protein
VKDSVVLMYCKDNVLYPVTLTQEEYDILQQTAAILFSPLKVVMDRPQGNVVNLMEKKKP